MSQSMIADAAVHDFALGNGASRADPASEAAMNLRRRAAWFARINAIIGIIVLVVVVQLARS